MIKKENLKNICELTPLQEAILFHSLERNAYIVQYSFSISNDLDIEIFKKSFETLIDRYDILKSLFIYENVPKPLQFILKKANLNFSFEEANSTEIEEFKLRDREAKFDLSKELSLRVKLFKIKENSFVFILTIHHIILDGWSIAILLKEFLDIYNSLKKDTPLKLNETIPFCKYVNWLNSIDEKETKEYWSNYLNQIENVNKFYKKKNSKFELNKIYLTLNNKKFEQFKSLARDSHVTLNSLIQSLWAIILAKYTNSNDVIFGTTTSGRNIEFDNIDSMVGLFINTIPTRVKLKDNFKELLKDIQLESANQLPYQNYPLYKIQKIVNKPLFDHILVFENYPIDENLLHNENFNVSGLDIYETTNYEFSLEILANEELNFIFKHNINAYDEYFIKNLRDSLEILIDKVLDDPNISISKLNILSSSQQKLLNQFNNITFSYPSKNIVELFEERVKSHPQSIALIFKEKKLTYGELNTKVNEVANYLIENFNIKSGDIVALLLDRSEYSIIAILAILKSGGAYVAIDKNFPKERIEYILSDANPVAILSDSNFGINIKNITHPNKSNPNIKISSESLAYIIYTSGTTGKPKGVMIEYSSIMARLYAMSEDYKVNSSDTTLQKTPYSFDVSVWESLLWIISGAKVCILKPNGHKEPSEIISAIEKNGVTMLHFVTSMLNAFLNYLNDNKEEVNRLSSIRQIFVGGEVLNISTLKLFNSLFQNAKLCNFYGPAETTIDVTAFECENFSDNYHTIPIGKPVANTSIYILNSNLEEVPIGVLGELYIGGVQVARGYLNKPQLTNEKFIHHPKFGKIYNSGDLAKKSIDGNIEYIGRDDEQVKIRGYRIELGEIETTLKSHPQIKEATINIKNGELIAYYVAQSELNDLRNFLTHKLAEYMVPKYYIKIASIPLTQNGKVDKEALPNVEIKSEYIEPQTNLEKKLAYILGEILSRKVGVSDDFFEVGGDSLKTIGLISKVSKELNIILSVQEIFENPTIKNLNLLIETKNPTKFIEIPKLNEADSYPISSEQKRIWLIDKIKGGTLYNILGVFEFDGELNEKALNEAFKALVNRHEILRTTFIEINDEVRQVINEVDFNMEILNANLDEVLQKEANRIFDLTKAPLLKVILLNSQFLIINMHHIISDWFSATIIMKELKEFYEAILENKKPNLKPLSIQYKEYANWQKSLKIDKSYFIEKFKTTPPKLELADFPRPTNLRHDGKTLNFEIDSSINFKIKEFVKEKRVTLFIFLETLLKILLYKYTNEKDITIGTIASNRIHESLQHQIGFYANTLPLRDKLNPNETFLETLKEIKSSTLKAFNYQAYQFDELIKDLNIEYEQNRNPLFDILLVLENDKLELNLKNLKIKELNIDLGVAKFDLSFYFKEINEKLIFMVEFNTHLFYEQKISNLTSHFKTLLESVISNPNEKISELNILTKKEKEFLTSLNNTSSGLEQKSIIEAFEEVVNKYPDNIAVIFEDKSLTYRELNEKTNEIANYLIENFNIQRDDLIAFMLDRSEYLVIAIFAILKAGGAYIPLDKKFPKERIDYILNSAKPKIILSDSDFGLNIKNITNPNKSNPNANITPNSLAYVIYTSGTTGEPKGVMIEHKSVVNFSKNLQESFLMNKKDRLYALTTITFDISILELISTLLNNICIVIASNQNDPFKIRDEIEKNSITTLQITPSRLNILINSINLNELNSLKRLLIGGEAFNKGLFEKLKDFNGEIYNVYGPTEATIWSTSKNLKDNKLNIGKPLLNEQIYILNENLQEVATNIVGELYIGGIGLARGYLNNKNLTDEKFINHPKFGRIYKSGDLAKINFDGEIEYIGRRDEQVKIRGFRIELGEIEATLKKHSQIKEAVLKVKNDDLLAYYIADEELTNLKEFLTQKLPIYMVPEHYMKIDVIPLNQNGKVDKKALPEFKVETKIIAPTNEIEEKLSQIWSEVLKLKIVSIEESFFNIGGNSLKLMELISKIFKELNVKVTFEEIFKYTTIKELAKLIETKSITNFEKIPKVSKMDSYELSSTQRRLWLIDKLESSNLYNILGVFELNGEVEASALNRAFKILVNRHEILRTNFIEVNGEGRQVINEIDFNIEEKEANIDEIIKEERTRVFNLAKEPLLKVRVINDKFLVVNMHHIISDGFSINIMINEISKIYEAILENREIKLKPLSIQFKDYSAWENSLSFETNYFKEKFATEVPKIELSSYPRPINLTHEGDSFSYELTNLEKMKEFAKNESITLFMFLVATLKTMLYKYSSERDLTIGTIVANREHFELQNQIGFYANTLPLRDKLNPKGNFLEFLKVVKENILKTFEFQSYPFDKLLSDLNIKREANHSPLFDILIVLQNEEEKLTLKNLEIKEILTTPEVAKFDLTFNFMEAEGKLKLMIDYNKNLFDKSKIETLAKHFEKLSNEILINPKEPLGDIDILLEDEKEIIKQKEITLVKSDIVREFEKKVREVPNSIALIYKDKSFTYKELNEKSNEIANYLKEKYKIYNDDFIAIMAKKSEWSIIGLLAILKSGGAYLPIDEDYPKERIDFIINNAKPKVILSDSDFLWLFENAEDIEKISYSNSKNPLNLLTYNSLAYLIYTSGSTGIPKGVMVEHGGFINMIISQIKTFNVSKSDRVIQFASLSFDASLSEIFMALLAGATLVVSDKELSGFEEYIKNQNITIATFPPSFLNTLSNLPTIKTLITAGEVPILEDIKRFSDKNYFNAYGPTENSVCATIYKVEKEGNVIPIGKPIDGVRVYILNENLKPVPIGAIGEIYIAGNSLARGYLNRSDENLKRFITINSERVYKSGDLGRWLNDGNIEFLGRGDEQVKVRGVRIELGEITNTLLKHPQIENVTLIKDEERLLAYYVGVEVDLRSYLEALLPHYMIPNSFIRVDTIPLTTNGKVDKKALLSIQIEHSYVAPQSEEEKLLVKIWSEVLGDSVGVEDNFFEVGGDSIKAIQISSRLLNEGYKCESKTIFEAKNIKILAQKLTKTKVEIDQSDVVGKIPLTPIQSWFFENFGMLEQFNQSILLKTNDLNENILKIVFEALIKHHDMLRASFYEDEKITQKIKENSELDFYSIDLRNNKNPSAMLNFYTERINSSLNLTNRLFKVVLFKLHDGDRIFIAMHHLIIDGISWRILLEDLKNSYLEYAKTQSITLPLKTHSYRDYSNALREYSKSQELLSEVSYWQNLKVDTKLSTDFEVRESLISESETIEMNLTQSETNGLLKEVSSAFNTEINDILLTTLARAIYKWQNISKVAINLEGHGREENLKLNLTKTIGWFTSIYPIVLNLKVDKELDFQIKDIKESLRKVPNRGFGFGILKYINKIEFNLKPEISFNYLGEFREFENELFSLAKEESVGEVSSEAKRLHLLDFIALIENSQFKLSIKYANTQFKKESISNLMEIYKSELLNIIAFCKNRSAELTPSDIDDEDFDIDTLNEFLEDFKGEFEE